jgi:hypothetical protein
MADAPDTLVLKRHRDLDGRRWHIRVRRTLMGLVVAVPVIALFNVFGQRPATTIVRAPAAQLKLYAPAHLRGGLLYMARFHITALQDIKKATLVLGPGWAEGITINTIEPSPIGEGSSNGRLVLQLGHIPAGGSYILFMDFQVNPTNVGRRSQDVTLADGSTALLTLHRKVTIYP